MSAALQHTYACLPTVNRGESVNLGKDPKGESFLYASGTSIVVRNLREPRICELYNGHPCATTVAAFAPSGYYVASGDSKGYVKIWSYDNPEHPIKFEGGMIAGPIKEIHWSEDSKRVCVVGLGKGKYGTVFMWDSGNTVGEIKGQSKGILSADIKQSRPYRIATGGEDFKTIWMNAFPAKFQKTIADHTRFVTKVRFSPDGSHLVTGGLDKKIFLYDGKTGDKKAEISSPDGHKGGIYGLEWSPDSTQFLTASADKTCKLWDVEAGSVVSTFTFSDSPSTEHQQLGCMWSGDYMLSCALDGKISYLDPSNPSKPSRVLKGHNKSITAIAKDSEGRISTASFDGVINRWEHESGLCEPFAGPGHSNQVNAMAVAGDTLVSGGMDDSVRFSSVSEGSFSSSISADSPVQSVSAAGDVTVFATMKSVSVVKGGSTVCREDTSYEPASVAISPDGKTVAVGGHDSKVHIYSFDGSALSQTNEIEEHRGPVGIAAFSPDGKWLVAGDLTKHELKLFDTGTYDLKVAMWVNHRSRINDVAWTPDSKHIASCDLAQDVYIWSVEKPMKKIYMKGAHRGGSNGVAWLDDTTLATTGTDACWRSWSITHH